MNLPRKIFGLLAPAAALAAAAIVGSGTAAQAASIPAAHVMPLAGVFNPIENVGNDLCLQPVTPAVSSPVVQEPCNGSISQGWEFVQVSGTTYGFLNQASGDCLFAFIGAENGAPMGLNTCRTVSNEQFDAHASLPNVTELESKIGFSDTGFCLDVPGASTAAGLQVQLFTCNGTLAQRWVVGFAS
jgi:Ricin-type beta-trefoil lectin domain-like